MSKKILSPFKMSENLQVVMTLVKEVLVRRGRTQNDADDFVQEAWIRLATHPRRDSILQPGAFLMRVALNLSVDAYRVDQRRGLEVPIEDELLVDPASSAESALLAKERVARLVCVLDRLSPRTREVFLAHRVDELSYSEIARVRGISVSAVERHVAKAVLAITTWMEGW